MPGLSLSKIKNLKIAKRQEALRTKLHELENDFIYPCILPFGCPIKKNMSMEN